MTPSRISARSVISHGLPRSRLLVRLAAALDGRCQGFASLVDRLAALLRDLARAVAAFARLFAEILARLAPRRRRVQERHRRAAHGAEQKRQQYASRSRAFIFRHDSSPVPVASSLPKYQPPATERHQMLTFTFRNFLGSFRISPMSACRSAIVLFILSYNSLLLRNWPAL